MQDGRTDRLESMYPQQICCMGTWGVQWNKYEQYRWINHKNQWRLSNTIWTNTLWTKTHIYASFVWAYLKQFSHMLCWAWYSQCLLRDNPALGLASKHYSRLMWAEMRFNYEISLSDGNCITGSSLVYWAKYKQNSWCFTGSAFCWKVNILTHCGLMAP